MHKFILSITVQGPFNDRWCWTDAQEIPEGPYTITNSEDAWNCILHHHVQAWAETCRRVWGGGKFFYVLAFSHRPHFVCLLPVSTVWNLIYNTYDPFLHETPLYQNKKFLHHTFFSHFILCHASNNTTSRNIGGTDAWAVPPPQIFGETFPPFPPPKSPHVCTRRLHSNLIMEIWELPI